MSEAEQGVSRERSTVEFPYSDLEDAVSVVTVIHQSGGMPMERDQIAVRMNQKATSGAFVTKLSAARMFGLVEAGASGKVQIAALGHEAIATDEGRQRAARATAFLNVELYRKMYDEFRGRQLPPRPGGLEQAVVAMGVAPKQRTNARYAFDRSAKYAGYFEHGNDRLVAPVEGVIAPPPKVAPAAEPERGQFSHLANLAPKRDLDGVITALIDKLPEGNSFPQGDRAAWLTMMAMAFDMAYGREGEITVTAKPSELPRLPVPVGVGRSFIGGAGLPPEEGGSE